MPVPFGMYETDIDLAALGLNGIPISSLTFTGGTVSDQPGVPNHGPDTGIFAVSGVAVPEPSTLLLAGSSVLAALIARRRVW
jgi:PEP-CTERM motif